MTGAEQLQVDPDVLLTPAGMMHLVRWLGRDGTVALINMLTQVRDGRRPMREDVKALDQALHATGLLDFPNRHRGSGFPGKRQW